MIDWSDAFDNSSYVEGSAQLPDFWASSARTFRDQLLKDKRAETDLAYGAQPRNQLDIFKPKQAPLGLVVFVHGGYWQRMDKSFWSHFSKGFLENSWAVAIPSYTLAPQASLTTMSHEIASAIRFASDKVAGPIRLVGHSAGGHLVTRMVCKNAPLSPELQKKIAKVVSISGIHDLRPLRLAEMNENLQLTEKEANDESPALHSVVEKTAVTLWVGAAERPELLRQTRLLAELWQRQGASDEKLIHDVYDTGKNHFSVIDAMTESTSPLVKEILS